jgi:hypothetical protein
MGDGELKVGEILLETEGVVEIEIDTFGEYFC